MAYKISGTKNDTARIFVFSEDTNTLETQVLVSGTGSYEIQSLTSGRKLVVARKADGESLAYGYVDSVDYSRGVFGGGTTAPENTIAYISISNAGNAVDFGDLTTARYYLAACSSSIRGIFSGYEYSNVIDYITITTIGNAADFGDMSVNKGNLAACSNSTRGVFGGGLYPGVNVIDYITIATTGNATTFGSLTLKRYSLAACSSTTRGLFGGGRNSEGASYNTNIIDYITIATTGNAADFGDLTTVRYSITACSNSTRGVFGNSPLDYITIATTGNATTFGNLSVSRSSLGACASSTRGVFAGGGETNIIDYIIIMTVGNAIDFGDLTISTSGLAGCSNGHGGLS